MVVWEDNGSIGDIKWDSIETAHIVAKLFQEWLNGWIYA